MFVLDYIGFVTSIALKARQTAEISRDFSAFFDSGVFRNFVDAFPRGALLAHHFGSVDRFGPTKRLKCLQSCGIMNVQFNPIQTLNLI